MNLMIVKKPFNHLNSKITTLDEHLMNERALRCVSENNKKLYLRNLQQAEYVIFKVVEDVWKEVNDSCKCLSNMRWANIETSKEVKEVEEMSLWQIDNFETDSAISSKLNMKNRMLLQRIDLIMSVSDAQLYHLKESSHQLMAKLAQIQDSSSKKQKKPLKHSQNRLLRNKKESSLASLRQCLENLVEASEYEQEELKQETDWHLQQYKAELYVLRSKFPEALKLRDKLINILE
jgi:hypothetical protein